MTRKATPSKKLQGRSVGRASAQNPGPAGRSRVSGPVKGQARRKDFLDQLWMLADSLDRSVERILKD